MTTCRRRRCRAPAARTGARRGAPGRGRRGTRGTARCPCARTGGGRRRGWAPGPAAATGASGLRAAIARGGELDERVVVDRAGGRDHDVRRAGSASAWKRGDLLRRGVGDHRRAADDRPAERMLAEHRLAEQVEHLLLRVVLVHRDLLEDHRALGVDVASAPGGTPCRPSRRTPPAHVLVDHPRVHRGRLLAGAGVELGAHRVEDLVDLERAVLLGALEQQVLEQVRQPRLRRRTRSASRCRSRSRATRTGPRASPRSRPGRPNRAWSAGAARARARRAYERGRSGSRSRTRPRSPSRTPSRHARGARSRSRGPRRSRSRPSRPSRAATLAARRPVVAGADRRAAPRRVLPDDVADRRPAAGRSGRARGRPRPPARRARRPC